jgi:DNA-binding transcriptional LysR family regulator
MLDSILLRTFIAVADHGSVTRASEVLHLTQSAVSAQVKRLEEQAGCRVFERTTRSLALTRKGSILLSYARSILQLQEQAVLKMSASRKPATTIRLGCSEGFAGGWLYAALAEFRQTRPDIHVEVTGDISTTLARQVELGSLDLVVGAFCDAQMQGETLWIEPMVWAYAARSLLDPELPVPFAFLSEPCPYREAALAALSRHGANWQVVLTAHSARAVVEAACAGLAVTVLTPSNMPPGLRPIPAGSFLPELPPAHFAIRFIESRATEPLRELVQLIREACFRWRGAASSA